MLFIWFVNLSFSLYFIHQIYSLRTSYYLSEKTVKTCIFIYLLLFTILSQIGFIYALIGIHFPVIAFIGLDCLLVYKLRKLFRIKLIELLHSCVGRIKIGDSFRESVRISLSSVENQTIQLIFQDVWKRVIYRQSPAKDQFNEYYLIYYILKKADAHLQPLTYLEQVRYSLKIEQQFQNKTKQALTQIYFQSYILIGLYLFLLAFTLFYYQLTYIYIICVSAFLFATGCLLVFMRGKNIKWTL